MPYVAVGDGAGQDRAEGSALGEGAPRAGDARAPAREASVTALSKITQRVREARASRPAARTENGERDIVRGRHPWTEGPASPAAMLEYTRSGAWVPGQQSPWLEGFGKAYGYAAFLLTLVVGAALWVVQRPSRAGLALVVGLALWFTWGVS